MSSSSHSEGAISRENANAVDSRHDSRILQRVVSLGCAEFGAAAIELSRYDFESLRADNETNLYRGRKLDELSSSAAATNDKSSNGREDTRPSSILVLAPALAEPDPETIKRFEHESSFRGELGAEWAVRPIGLTRHEDRTMLVLEDPGGELLESFLGPARDASSFAKDFGELSRAATEHKSVAADAGEQPMELGRFLQLAISLASALSKLHSHGLIHKDIKPANILVDPVETASRANAGPAVMEPVVMTCSDGVRESIYRVLVLKPRDVRQV